MSLLPSFMLVDRLEITRPAGKTRTSMGAIVDQNPTVVFTDEPCRIDVLEVRSDEQTAGVRPTARRVIYCRPGLDIQRGDFVKVTRPDASVVNNHRVKSIDDPALFKINHLEVEIEPIGAV